MKPATRRSLGSFLGGIAGLALGLVIIGGLMDRSQDRRYREGRSGPGDAQAEAIYVYIGFILVPVSTVSGVALGRRLAE